MTRASDLAKLLGAGATILDGTTISTADNTDQLTLLSTDADANVGPNLNLFRNSGSPADDDILGLIIYNGRNDNSQDVIYARQVSYIKDASDGTEDGQLSLQTMVAGTIRDRLNITPTEIVLNEDSVDLDFRVESDNLANAFFINGANGNIGIGTSSPFQFSSVQASLTLSGTSGSFATRAGALTFQSQDTTSTLSHIHARDGYMAFDTGTSSTTTERMRLQADGTLSIGTTNDTNAKLYVFNSNTEPVTFIQSSSNGNDGVIAINTSINQNAGNTDCQHLKSTTQNVGTFKLNGNGSSTFSSDERLKKNIETTRDGYLEDLAKLRVVKYNWHCHDDSTDKELGLIAQEVQKVFPKLIVEDDVELNGIEKPLAIKNSVLPMMLLKALQEANTKITALEARITALETA